MSNQYLEAVGTLGDVVLSKLTKPMHVKFTEKGTLVQNNYDIIARGPIVNTYIVYKTSLIILFLNSNFVCKNCFFGAIKIANTTNSDNDKWQYSGYIIGFDSTGNFEADVGNSRLATNKIQSVLILGHGLIQKINDTTIYVEKMYSPNFTVDNKTFCLSLHYNSDNSYLFVNGKEVTKFKAENSELIKYPKCLGGLSKDYNKNSRKDTGLYGNVYDFSIS